MENCHRAVTIKFNKGVQPRTVIARRRAANVSQADLMWHRCGALTRARKRQRLEGCAVQKHVAAMLHWDWRFSHSARSKSDQPGAAIGVVR